MKRLRWSHLSFFTWLFGRGQLKTVTLLPFSLLFVLAFLLSWVLSFNNARQGLASMMERLASGISDHIAVTLDGFLQVAVLQNEQHRAYIELHPDFLAEPERLLPYFHGQLRLRPGLNITAFGKADGSYVEAQRQPDGLITYGLASAANGQILQQWWLDDGLAMDRLYRQQGNYDPRRRPWYEAAERAEAAAWSPVYTYALSDELAVSNSLPLLDATGQVAGVFTSSITLEALSVFLDGIDTGPGGFILLMEIDGSTLATSMGIPLVSVDTLRRRSVLELGLDLINSNVKALQDPDARLVFHSPEGRFFVSRRVHQLGADNRWYSLVFLNERDFSAAIRLSNAQTATVLAIVFLLTLIISWAIAAYLTWPLSILSTATSQLVHSGFQKPDFVIPPSVLVRQDEIGKLARVFNLMTEELDGAIHGLQRSLAEKEALLQEINHRVKNNLQLICSLLNLQAGSIEDLACKQVFRVSQERIQTMAILHEEFYSSEVFADISVAAYIGRLRDELNQVYLWPGHEVRVETSLEDIRLSLVQAIPVGLFFYEAYSNALKYAYRENLQGTIWLSLCRAEDDRVRLTIRDQGAGLDGRVDPGTAVSLGFSLMHSLARQLNGRLEISAVSGVCCSLIFPPQ